MNSPASNIDVARVEAKLTEHIKEYTMHRQEYLERQAHQDVAHENNMKAIAELTSATKDVVDAWAVANGFQKFIKWLGGFGIVGVLGLWIADMFKSTTG